MSETRSLLRSDAAQPQLEIVQGLHAGVRLDLKDGEYSIGPTPNADLVLRDKGVLSQHALLRIELGEVRVEATGGDVSVGNLKIAAGHGCRLRLPAVVGIGDASLRFSRGGEPDGTLFGRMMAAARGRPVEVAGGVLLCAVAVAVVSQTAPRTPPENPKTQLTISAAARSAAEDSVTTKAANAAAASSTVKQAADDLEDRLRVAGIRSLRITADDQRISAQGRLPATQAAQWTAIQRWFDEKHGSNVVLTANVATGQMAGAPLLRLQSVWFGDRPYIIADNGSRYYEGSVLDSGWILQRIADDGLLLRKEDETFALTYR